MSLLYVTTLLAEAHEANHQRMMRSLGRLLPPTLVCSSGGNDVLSSETTFASFFTNGRVPDAAPNVMLVLGNGTQGFFANNRDSYVLYGNMEKHFGTDAFLNDFASLIQQGATSAAAKFAIVTLNISWAFDHQFAFHGSLANANIPETEETDRYVDAALDYVSRTFDPARPVHIVFIGVGLTDKNGKGLCVFIGKVRSMYAGGVSRVTVIDPSPMTVSRTVWLNTKCGFDGKVPIEHVAQTAEAWVAPLKAGYAYSGPTYEDMKTLLESEAVARAFRTNDGRVRDFIDTLVRVNGFTHNNVRVGRKRRKTTQSLVKRSISEVDNDVVKIRGSTDREYTVVRNTAHEHRYDLRDVNNILTGFAIAFIDSEDAQLVLVLDSIFLFQQGKGLCTPFLSAVLADVIARETDDDEPPPFGRVKIVSTQARAAFKCYVNAFGNVGYVLVEGDEPPFDVAPADEKWVQTLRFVHRGS